ncbi:MAG: iron-containing redox enzyme family protein [Acidobacteria bacterium]|nr:iron-containing redox enzyme family protein [Acidobacteriota bacterium]MBK8813561.1 iron-containing redox enzyme family protein [Acidobacteriota bacterium]
MSDFQKQLETARQPTHSGMHPFSQAWVDGDLSREQLGRWAIQHYYYIEPIAQQFAILFSRLPDLDARTHMLENLLGEEDPKGRHPDLLLDFAEHCGVDREYATTAEFRGEILPTTRAMRSWIWELVSQRSLAEAAAGIMVGLEGQLPTLYPKYVTRLHQMGFDDSQLQFFHVHIEGDIEHAHVGLELADRYATTDDLKQRAIGAVRASGQLRWAFLSGMYDAIVKS